MTVAVGELGGDVLGVLGVLGVDVDVDDDGDGDAPPPPLPFRLPFNWSTVVFMASSSAQQYA